MKVFLVIRFTTPQDIKNQVSDLEIPLSVDLETDDINQLTNVKWIKSVIRNRASECSNRRLRLIYGGRVLNENTDFEKDIFTPRFKQYKQTELESEPFKIFIHCLIGDRLTLQQLSDENKLDSSVQTKSTTPEVIGFDRLLQQGFSQDDIRDLRQQFHSIYNPLQNGSRSSRTNGEINDLEEEESQQRQTMSLEERWIESTITPLQNNVPGPESHQQPSQTGGPQLAASPQLELEENNRNVDMLIGLLIGVFFGVLGLLLLAVDDSIFNKQQKMSLFAGVFINFTFAIIRGQWV